MNHYIEISLVETCGKHLFGSPDLFYWFGSVEYGWPDTVTHQAEAVLLALEHGVNWTHHARSVSLEEAHDILDSLTRLGIPGRKLDVKGFNHASEFWTKLTFRLQLQAVVHFQDGHRTSEFSLDLYPYTGFEGKAAPALCQLFHKLLTLAGAGDKTLRNRTTVGRFMESLITRPG